MKRVKKILSILLKSAIGIGASYILYARLEKDLGEDELVLMRESFHSSKVIMFLLLAFLMVPLNWGLESKKWQLITREVEPISFKTASLSVYSGICAGNFAPGRATEFLGKLLYFSDPNKARVALLHFLNGMIQLSITLVAGITAMVFRLDEMPEQIKSYALPTLIVTIILLTLFLWLALRSEMLIQKLSIWFSARFPVNLSQFSISSSLWLKLTSLSLVRYVVFCSQFYILLQMYPGDLSATPLAGGIALYFMVTSLLPMISFLEAPIRAAIALVVLAPSGLSPSQLALSTLILWFLNIVLPSLAGYLALLKMEFDFKLLFQKKK